MNLWRNLDRFGPRSVRRDPAGRVDSGSHPRPIEVDGVFLGATVDHALGVRFIATDARVTEMDQSIWPNVDYAVQSARQLFRPARSRALPKHFVPNSR
jgi:hypothetical protein